MARSRKLISLGLIWVTLPFLAVAQNPGSQVVTPNGVSADAPTGQVLHFGQKFTFLLQFSPAPDNLGEGNSVEYIFENAQGNHTGMTSDPWNVVDSKPLQNGQSGYSFTLTVNESMSPGKWRLAHVVIVGRRAKKEVQVRSDVGFEVLPPTPIRVHVQAPSKAITGQTFSLKVTLDEYPHNFSCSLSISAFIVAPSSPDVVDQFHVSMVNPKGSRESLVIPGNPLVYEFSGVIEREAPEGIWEGFVMVGAMGVNRGYCAPPRLEGDKKFSVTVQHGPQPIYPSSVSVMVNPKQIDLLHVEAQRLMLEAEHLRDKLTSSADRENDELLRTRLGEALEDVDKTEKAFKEMGGDTSLSSHEVNAFFDDIRYDYGEDLKLLGNQSARASSPKPTVMLASLGASPSRLKPASAAILRSISHNAQVYEFAASTKALVFNLIVTSAPPGATISWKQRGDNHYNSVDHATDWRIENLVIGTYFIRVQKEGCESNEVEFSDVHSSVPSINIPMKCKRGSK